MSDFLPIIGKLEMIPSVDEQTRPQLIIPSISDHWIIVFGKGFLKFKTFNMPSLAPSSTGLFSKNLISKIELCLVWYLDIQIFLLITNQ